MTLCLWGSVDWNYEHLSAYTSWQMPSVKTLLSFIASWNVTPFQLTIYYCRVQCYSQGQDKLSSFKKEKFIDFRQQVADSLQSAHFYMKATPGPLLSQVCVCVCVFLPGPKVYYNWKSCTDLQCIQAIHFLFIFISMCVPWELNPRHFALLTQCSTSEPQEHMCI